MAYSTLSDAANRNLESGKSVYGGLIDDDTWINPHFNPDQNAGGYTRFDKDAYGAGLERAQTYYDGARLFDQYMGIGNTRAQDAQRYLSEMGATPETATDQQKFDALDASFREAQAKNQRPKRKFGIDDLVGILGPVAAGILTGGVAGPALGLGSIGSGILGGTAAGITRGGITGDFDLGDIATGAALGGLGGYLGPKIFGAPAAGGITGGAGDVSSVPWGVLDDIPSSFNYGLDTIMGAPGIAGAASSVPWGVANAIPRTLNYGVGDIDTIANSPVTKPGPWSGAGIDAANPADINDLWSPNISHAGTDQQLWDSTGPGSLIQEGPTRPPVEPESDLLKTAAKTVAKSAAKGLLNSALTPDDPGSGSGGGLLSPQNVGSPRDPYDPYQIAPYLEPSRYFGFGYNPFGAS